MLHGSHFALTDAHEHVLYGMPFDVANATTQPVIGITSHSTSEGVRVSVPRGTTGVVLQRLGDRMGGIGPDRSDGTPSPTVVTSERHIRRILEHLLPRERIDEIVDALKQSS